MEVPVRPVGIGERERIGILAAVRDQHLLLGLRRRIGLYLLVRLEQDADRRSRLLEVPEPAVHTPHPVVEPRLAVVADVGHAIVGRALGVVVPVGEDQPLRDAAHALEQVGLAAGPGLLVLVRADDVDRHLDLVDVVDQ